MLPLLGENIHQAFGIALQQEKGGLFLGRLKSSQQVLEFKLQLKLEDASRYRCTLEVAIGAARRGYSVLHGAKGTTS